MLKLHAGVSKKVGLPGFSSASASCTIEAELDGSLLQDHEGFQIVVKRAYQSCEQAVQDQIARLTNDGKPNSQHTHQEVIEVRTSPSVNGLAHLSNARAISNNGAGASMSSDQNQPVTLLSGSLQPRPATLSQVRAIRAIAARRKIDLVAVLQERFGMQTPNELGIRQASVLIDELKGESPAEAELGSSPVGNGACAVHGGAQCQ